MKLLLFGATGKVGEQVLLQALEEAKFTHIIAPTRKALAHSAEKLSNPVIDFDHLIEFEQVQANVVICALGTTLKQAGSKDAFAKVDYQYVTQIAKLTAPHCPHFILNSSLGADQPRGFYLSIKAKAENAVLDAGFKHVTIVRPSLIAAEHRPDFRLGETLALKLTAPIKRWLPAKYRPVTPQAIAKAMLSQALSPNPQAVISNQMICEFDK